MASDIPMKLLLLVGLVVMTAASGMDVTSPGFGPASVAKRLSKVNLPSSNNLQDARATSTRNRKLLSFDMKTAQVPGTKAAVSEGTKSAVLNAKILALGSDRKLMNRGSVASSYNQAFKRSAYKYAPLNGHNDRKLMAGCSADDSQAAAKLTAGPVARVSARINAGVMP